MTRTTASATSLITSALRSRARPAPAVERCPASFSEMLTTRSRSCSSGVIPNSRPVTIDTSSVNRKTSGSRPISPQSWAGCPGSPRASPEAAEPERGAERAADHASRTPSVRNWRSRRQRPAPSADRIANSLCRDSARRAAGSRGSRRRSSSTKPTAPWSTQRPPDAADEISLQAVEPQAMVFLFGHVRLRILTATSPASTRRRLSPGRWSRHRFSRPTRYRKCRRGSRGSPDRA